MIVVRQVWTSLNSSFEARASEWALSAGTLSLGMVSMWNPYLFREPQFTNLLRIFSIETWTMLLVLVGLLRLVVLFINGSWWPTPFFRSVFAFLSCFLWAQIVLGFSGNQSWGVAFFPWILALDAYNSIRAGKEGGLAFYIQSVKWEATQNGLVSHKQ